MTRFFHHEPKFFDFGDDDGVGYAPGFYGHGWHLDSAPPSNSAHSATTRFQAAGALTLFSVCRATMRSMADTATTS